MEEESKVLKVSSKNCILCSVLENGDSFDVLYIVIGIFAIVILLLLVTLVIVLSRRRNRSNMKLIEIANDQSKRR